MLLKLKLYRKQKGICYTGQAFVEFVCLEALLDKIAEKKASEIRKNIAKGVKKRTNEIYLHCI